jgi:hypothetical protein
MLGHPGAFAEEQQHQTQRGLLGQGDRVPPIRAPGLLLFEAIQVLGKAEVKKGSRDRSIQPGLPLVRHIVSHLAGWLHRAGLGRDGTEV